MFISFDCFIVFELQQLIFTCWVLFSVFRKSRKGKTKQVRGTDKLQPIAVKQTKSKVIIYEELSTSSMNSITWSGKRHCARHYEKETLERKRIEDREWVAMDLAEVQIMIAPWQFGRSIELNHLHHWLIGRLFAFSLPWFSWFWYCQLSF